MSKAVFRKQDGRTLVATDQQGLDLLASLRPNRDVLVEVKQARCVKQHRLLFAVLKFLVDHVEHFQNTEQALIALKIAVGLTDVYVDQHTGKTFFIPRSISFASMPQGEFAAFFDRAVSCIVTRWLPDVSEDSVRAEIEAMVSPNRAHAA